MKPDAISRVGTVLLTVTVGVTLAAQEAPQTEPREETSRLLVVTFDGKLDTLPELAPEDFEIEVGKQKFPPDRVHGVGDLPFVLAIVLQDNLVPEFEAQLPALQDFIRAQSEQTYIGYFYLFGRDLESPEQFDADLGRVAEAVRAPKAKVELAPPSPYPGLAAVLGTLQRLPAARKQVLFFSDGSDVIPSQGTPRLDQAVEMAQRAGIPVWTIRTKALTPRRRGGRGGGGSRRGQRGGAPSDRVDVTSNSGPVASNMPTSGGTPSLPSGNSLLKKLAKQTGGKSYSVRLDKEGLKPVLDEIQELFQRQYVLEYSADGPPKKVKLKRKVKGAKLLALQR